MKNQKFYDHSPASPQYTEMLDEAQLPHQFYNKSYEEIMMGDEDEEILDDEPTLREALSEIFQTLRERSRKGQWGKISVLCSLLLAFSMLYSGDKKEEINSSLLLRASAEETKNINEMSGEELENLRFQEQIEKESKERKQEDTEIVRNLQLLKEMKDREVALKQREEQLRVKEGQMRTIEEGVNSRIAEMEKLKNQLQELVTLRKDLGEKSISQLVKVYENMKPSEASNVLERIDEDISVQVLLRMKGKKAGKILNVMKPAISVRLSEEIARRK